jgi:hypothetical protein
VRVASIQLLTLMAITVTIDRLEADVAILIVGDEETMVNINRASSSMTNISSSPGRIELFQPHA